MEAKHLMTPLCTPVIAPAISCTLNKATFCFAPPIFLAMGSWTRSQVSTFYYYGLVVSRYILEPRNRYPPLTWIVFVSCFLRHRSVHMAYYGIVRLVRIYLNLTGKTTAIGTLAKSKPPQVESGDACMLMLKKYIMTQMSSNIELLISLVCFHSLQLLTNTSIRSPSSIGLPTIFYLTLVSR
jgi:hypothetical protein